MSDKKFNRRRRKHGESRVVDPASPLFDSFEEMRTCKSKNAYDSEWQAQFVIDETFKKYGNQLGSYQCPYCNKWHLTEFD